jgi:hypothetical protein
MILEAKFTENDQVLNADFGEVHRVERGGYEEGYKEGYDTGYTEGFNSAPPDYMQYMINTPSFIKVFPENARDVTLNLSSVSDLNGFGFFSETNITSLKLIAPNLTTFQMYYAFNKCKSLKFVDFSQCNEEFKLRDRADSTFAWCEVLEKIIGTLDFSNVGNVANAFRYCYALQELRVAPLSIKLSLSLSDSPNLSPETIQSIIDGLADLTGETAQTLTLHADVGAKLTDEQKAVIIVKNWILAY